MSNYFEELNNVNVAEKIEEKNGLSYLSWAWAWGELKKRHPDATYTIYENAAGWNYHTDGHTCWVKTGVTVGDIEHIEYLPVMDYKNRSILQNDVTSYDVNKAIQRSLTKAVARHGLGLYIYAGEDLPECDKPETPVAPPPPPPAPKLICPSCLNPVKGIRKDGKDYPAEEVVKTTKGFCYKCWRALNAPAPVQEAIQAPPVDGMTPDDECPF